MYLAHFVCTDSANWFIPESFPNSLWSLYCWHTLLSMKFAYIEQEDVSSRNGTVMSAVCLPLICLGASCLFSVVRIFYLYISSNTDLKHNLDGEYANCLFSRIQ